ncbi:hypothetical protein WA026_005135 [Henosepilachna vigintioctopunctata]|uniref:Uncharacterized protein n=1 Tax=Henosepilachna vigintioctopunctata TaxID=420089 RepID=A0AAW1UTR1_9CUCU
MVVQQLCEMMEAREFSNVKPKKNKKDKKKILLGAQELKIARALAGNDKSIRDRALKSLKRWFYHRSQNFPFTEEDFMRLWKGLFYSMWMSDKALVQEECAENIADLLHQLPVDHSLKFFKCGLATLMSEWFGIDQLRLDKFMMFVRRLLRQSLMVLKKSNFNKQTVIHYGELLDCTIFDLKKKNAVGLFFHFTEIFWEELAKVTEGNLKPDLLNSFLTPFVKCLATSDDTRIIKHLQKFVFIHLMSQTNVGLEYQEKYNAWKKEGFPGTIHSMQKVEDIEDASCIDCNENKSSDEGQSSKSNKPLDPRAGRVDVELPQIVLNPKKVAALLLEYKFINGSSVPGRKAVTLLAQQFKKLANGNYPLGETNLKLEKSELNDMKLKKAVNRLVKFENKLLGKNSRSKKRKLDSKDMEHVAKKQKTEEEIEEREQEEGEDNFDAKLEEFIKNSEGSLQLEKKNKISTKKQNSSNKHEINSKKQKHQVETDTMDIETPIKKRIKKSDISDFIPESQFERNSGLWFVFNQSELDESDILDDSNSDLGNLTEDKIDDDRCTSNGSELFPKNPWDEPLQEGEYEISIPSKSYVKKLKNMSKKSTYNLQNLINKNLLKSQHSKKHSQSSTTPNYKRVKINTRLNQSQEFDDYHSQMLTSPAITFDASKKPGKPLLKTPTVNSPINPFYNQL